MILASHQPNFIPYLGYFYKMFVSDIFTISDEVQFSRSGFQNFNFVNMSGDKLKITVPVASHVLPINKTEIVGWDSVRKKMMKTFECAYGRSKHYDCLEPIIKEVCNHDYKFIHELNIDFIMKFAAMLGIDRNVRLESSMFLDYQNPSHDICQICQKCNADYYLSGIGAKGYMDMKVFNENKVKVIWSNYVDKWGCMSVADYIANNGSGLPDGFEEMKEKILCKIKN